MNRTVDKPGHAKKLAAAATALALTQAGCSAALWGNFLIVLLALAIFVGTIRLGGGDDGK